MQAGLHADEAPGIAVAHHLEALLDRNASGVIGEIWVVAMANPIGLDQWISHKPQGRQDLESMQNFNRGYPDLAALVADQLDGQLTDDPSENLGVIRQAFSAALAEQPRQTELDKLRLGLLGWSHDADVVLDLHCDHEAVLHFYASPIRPDLTNLLARATGAALVLEQEVSGGNAFDEAHTAPWAALRRRFGDRVPAGCFSTTLEYRGQRDVSDDVAAEDAARLVVFLTAVGAIAGDATPAFAVAPVLPLGGAAEHFAPQGGVVIWAAVPGNTVTKGQLLAEVLDPLTRHRAPVTAEIDGLLFRRELWRTCRRGQSLCHVAGSDVLRTGHLLSD